MKTNFNGSCMPRLFQVSDELAARAQKKYLRSVRIHIAALIGASVSQAIASLGLDFLDKKFFPESTAEGFRVLVAGFVIVALFTRFLLRQRYWEGIWINSRAIAEKLRRASWQYMMRVSIQAPPQAQTIDNGEQRREFLHMISGFSSQLVKLSPPGFDLQIDLPEISPEMETIRKSPFEERLRFYAVNRVKQQAEWLIHDKALLFDKYAKRCAWALNVVEALALLTVLLIFISTDRREWLSVLWPLLTIAASIVAWTGYKRYSEVSSSYKETAEALNSIRNEIEDGNEGRHVEPERFATLVYACEDALLRENKLWATRRGF